MGSAISCFHASSSVSSDAQQPQPPPAMVVAADGSLKELRDPALASVSDVLGGSDAASSSFFMCNSDALYFNEPPPELAAGERLRPGQMYFLLPAAMQGRRLSSADMAALAARAISALPAAEKKPRRGRGGGKQKRLRVVPVLVREDGKDGEEEEGVFYETLNAQTLGEFAVLTRRARSGDEVAAAATRKKKPSALKRALSMIREDAE